MAGIEPQATAWKTRPFPTELYIWRAQLGVGCRRHLTKE